MVFRASFKSGCRVRLQRAECNCWVPITAAVTAGLPGGPSSATAAVYSSHRGQVILEITMNQVPRS